MGEVSKYGQASPFDAIRREREDGSEYWSARDLYPLMGYSTWQNFGTAIQRAIHSGRNTGMDVTSQFMRVHNLVDRPQGGTGKVEDLELSREAAYLVALNGDPTKPESAAAQAYFVVRTMQAETVRRTLSNRELALMVIAEADRAEAAERELAEAAPKVARFEQLQSTEGTLLVGEVATALGIPGLGGGNLWHFLRHLGWVWQNGTRPTVDAVKAGYMVAPLREWDDTNRSDRAGVDPQTYVTPQGAIRLAEVVAEYGWTKTMSRRRWVTRRMIEDLPPTTFRKTPRGELPPGSGNVIDFPGPM